MSKETSRHVYIHESVLSESRRVFRKTRSLYRRHESIVYWAGREDRDALVVTTCIAPNAKTTAGSFRTSASSNAHAISRTNELGLAILAQVHTHPGPCTEHSNGDSAGALMPYDGFYSLVIPGYGTRPLWPLTTAGVYVYLRGRFVRLGATEIQNVFRLLPALVDLR